MATILPSRGAPMNLQIKLAQEMLIAEVVTESIFVSFKTQFAMPEDVASLKIFNKGFNNNHQKSSNSNFLKECHNSLAPSK